MTGEIEVEVGEYDKSTNLNGADFETEVVDSMWVQRYVNAASWFEGIGGHEENSIDDNGVITCVATSPDGEDVRTTVFTPRFEVKS